MDAAAIAYRAIELGAMQKQDELAELLEILIKRRPRRVLELGVAMGGTLYAWRELGAEVFAVDQVADPRFNPYGSYILIADSHAPATALEVREVADSVDFLFIDGDHTYAGAKQDLDWYWSLVRPGGLIGLHDICHHADPDVGVDRLWRELRGMRKREIVRPPRNWGGIGLLEV